MDFGEKPKTTRSCKIWKLIQGVKRKLLRSSKKKKESDNKSGEYWKVYPVPVDIWGAIRSGQLRHGDYS